MRPSALETYLNRSDNRQNSPSPQRRQEGFTQDSGSWETNFFQSKNECLNELGKLIRKVDREEGKVRAYMKDYQLGVLEQLDSEYRALKAELCKALDGAYEKCIIKVKEGFLGEQMGELERALKRLEGIRQKIRSFEFQLETNYTYKKGISHVVLENFQAQRAELIGSLNAALKSYEGKVFLRVEPHQYAKMKEALQNLFTYTGHHVEFVNREYPNPRMFPPPAPSNILQSIPNGSFNPITSVNEGAVPDPHLIPPFKPFPPRRPDSNIQQNTSNQNDYHSGIRYTAPNPEFDRIFNDESPPPRPGQNQQIVYEQSQRIPGGLSHPRSNSPSSHRNRDLIRQSGRSNR